jgi:hypothetical protein
VVTVRTVGNIAAISAGQKVGLTLNLHRLHMFAADGTKIPALNNTRSN